jgi:hypothetical protein
MVNVLAETEHRMGVANLLLWVLDDNHDAQLAYKALGFEPTGECQFLPTVGQFERRLGLPNRTLIDSRADAASLIVDRRAGLSEYSGLRPKEIEDSASEVPICASADSQLAVDILDAASNDSLNSRA